jgi:hypothetical protein
MNRFTVALILFVAVGRAHAELVPPPHTVQPVADPSMVVMDRGAKLEVLATKRATPEADGSGRIVAHHLAEAKPSDTISAHRLGVVFNHALQQQGYITGEIVFKMKAGHEATALPASLYPGLQKVTDPQVYAVTARSATEFLALVKRLQARADLEWVEPTVTYAGDTN